MDDFNPVSDPHTRYPIVLDRDEPCYGKHNGQMARHHIVIYPDKEYHTCSCGHKTVYDYTANRGARFSVENEHVAQELESVVSDIRRHKFGKTMGKKDRTFFESIIERIMFEVRRLRGE